MQVRHWGLVKGQYQSTSMGMQAQSRPLLQASEDPLGTSVALIRVYIVITFALGKSIKCKDHPK